MTNTVQSISLRILLSEGSSTSAREAITALGGQGHRIEVCDPDPHCLGRFSRYVHKFHKCPGIARNPREYISFILHLVSRRSFDVLLPIHEQGLLFAKVQEQLKAHINVALPSFESYCAAHNKADFGRLLEKLDLPQPKTRLLNSLAELRDFVRFPSVVKMSVGTASRGTWIIRDKTDLQSVQRELTEANAFQDEVLLQEFIEGPVEHAQAIFQHGRLWAFHAYRQLLPGAGGGDALKESVRRPFVRADVARIGEQLAWHGALSVDYIFKDGAQRANYIDCNPRLVEPMNALWAGLDLTKLLIEISRGAVIATSSESRPGIRTHLAIQALLGCALRTQSRLALLREWRILSSRTGRYAGSREELTPVRLDWLSIVPLVMTLLFLVVNPGLAHALPRRGWGSHLLSPQSIRKIKAFA